MVEIYTTESNETENYGFMSQITDIACVRYHSRRDGSGLLSSWNGYSWAPRHMLSIL
jgi:hypothetical protein